MVVGNKSAGKSSLIHRLQNKDDIPTPTTALEYRFARSTRGTIKDVAHIWELAGGTHLTDLIDIPVSESNIHLTTFVIVIDLSVPEDALPVLEHFLDKIQTRSKRVLDGLEARGSKRPKGLRAFAVKKYGNEHPDIQNQSMYICPIPIVIVGSKYDLFRDLEPEKRKLFCKTLRFLAHTNGATLIFANLKDESSCAKVRRVLNHHAFRSNPLQELSQDYNKPLIITPGQDAFSQIGLPPSEAGQHKDAVGKQSFANYDKWRTDFDRYFLPKKDASSKIEKIDFSKYVEPRVDAMRAQKELRDEELERMRRNETKKIPIKELLSQVSGTQQKSTSVNGKGYSRAKAMGMAQ
ncbi:UNVERIFIED_CONTAM: Cytoplasmic dynein 2 light intermediate chain 1 [Siphonaria sp. JEL0065]|nr:Cytoplasmic dynein 2 light intermediate chain 1 [Siphonaria sp. JEL0065]